MFLIKVLVVSASCRIEPDRNLFLGLAKDRALVITLLGKIKDLMFLQEILMQVITNLVVKVQQTDIKHSMGVVLLLEWVKIMKYKN